MQSTLLALTGDEGGMAVKVLEYGKYVSIIKSPDAWKLLYRAPEEQRDFAQSSALIKLRDTALADLKKAEAGAEQVETFCVAQSAVKRACASAEGSTYLPYPSDKKPIHALWAAAEKHKQKQ